MMIQNLEQGELLLKNWIIISPEGITVAPNDNCYGNFQVLGFANAYSEEGALEQLIEKYDYLNGSGFEEIWIYPLETRTPYITYLQDETTEKDEFNDNNATVNKIIEILKENFTNITFDYTVEDSYYFEAFSDALQEVRVDLVGNTIEVYDKYITEKHFVFLGRFQLR